MIEGDRILDDASLGQAVIFNVYIWVTNAV